MKPFVTAALSLCFVCDALSASVFTGRIVGVADGDTVTLLEVDKTQRRIRIAGIDAPEKRQAFGQRSRLNMSDLAFGKDAEAQCAKNDRYGRYVCVVSIEGLDIGLEQIRAGLAWWYRKYAAEQTPEQRREYELAQSLAQVRELALWSDADPVPPWQWRHKKAAATAKQQ